MRKFHRFIAAILVMAMVLGLMPMNITASAEEIPAENISVGETVAPVVEETVPTEAEPEETVSEETVPEVTSVTGEVQTEYADTYDATITTLYSGSCGSGVSWRLTSDYVLTISGSGAMDDYSNRFDVPWNNHIARVKEVVIENGVTSIGSVAFMCCESLTKSDDPQFCHHHW